MILLTWNIQSYWSLHLESWYFCEIVMGYVQMVQVEKITKWSIIQFAYTIWWQIKARYGCKLVKFTGNPLNMPISYSHILQSSPSGLSNIQNIQSSILHMYSFYNAIWTHIWKISSIIIYSLKYYFSEFIPVRVGFNFWYFFYSNENMQYNSQQRINTNSLLFENSSNRLNNNFLDTIQEVIIKTYSRFKGIYLEWN